MTSFSPTCNNSIFVSNKLKFFPISSHRSCSSCVETSTKTTEKYVLIIGLDCFNFPPHQVEEIWNIRRRKMNLKKNFFLPKKKIEPNMKKGNSRHRDAWLVSIAEPINLSIMNTLYQCLRLVNLFLSSQRGRFDNFYRCLTWILSTEVNSINSEQQNEFYRPILDHWWNDTVSPYPWSYHILIQKSCLSSLLNLTARRRTHNNNSNK